MYAKIKMCGHSHDFLTNISLVHAAVIPLANINENRLIFVATH